MKKFLLILPVIILITAIFTLISDIFIFISIFFSALFFLGLLIYFGWKKVLAFLSVIIVITGFIELFNPTYIDECCTDEFGTVDISLYPIYFNIFLAAGWLFVFTLVFALLSFIVKKILKVIRISLEKIRVGSGKAISGAEKIADDFGKKTEKIADDLGKKTEKIPKIEIDPIEIEHKSLKDSYELYFLHKVMYRYLDIDSKESRVEFWIFMIYAGLTILIVSSVIITLLTPFTQSGAQRAYTGWEQLLQLFLIVPTITMIIRRIRTIFQSSNT